MKEYYTKNSRCISTTKASEAPAALLRARPRPHSGIDFPGSARLIFLATALGVLSPLKGKPAIYYFANLQIAMFQVCMRVQGKICKLLALRCSV